MDHKKKKKEKGLHPFDTWPPKDEKKEGEKPQDRKLKPRNTGYVDPDEYRDVVPEPVYEIDEPETHEEKDHDGPKNDDEKEDK